MSMSTMRRIGFCPRGYHEVALSHERGQGLQCMTLQSTTERGNYVAVTYFRCKHCRNLFVVEGGLPAVKTRKSWPATVGEIPKRHRIELEKTCWWPKPSTLDVTNNLLSEVKAAAKAWKHYKVGGFSGGPLPDGLSQADIACNLLKEAAAKRWAETPTVVQGVPVTVSGSGPAVARVMKALDKLKEVSEHLDRQALKDRIFCHVAETVAELATCCRLKVGCFLLTKEGRLCGQGYNGAGPGMPHCDPAHCNANCRCRRTRHAEKNALSNCAGTPYTAYLTHEPCCDCAKDLIAEGVRRVVYVNSYNSMPPEEWAARQEWIDFYQVRWEQLPKPLEGDQPS